MDVGNADGTPASEGGSSLLQVSRSEGSRWSAIY